MNDDELTLSNDSGFQSDWKSIYHRDALFWASQDLHTDSIMKTLAGTIHFIARQFKLSPAIEFTTIDMLELLLVRRFQRQVQSKAKNPNALVCHKDAFLRQLPMYMVAMIDIVAKYIDASAKLDLVALRRVFKTTDNGPNMLTVEFEVIKVLDGEIRSSLLLGAVERFSKKYLIPLNVASREFITQIGIKLLRVVTAERALIYNSLKASIKDRECFRRFKSSKLILAGSIVITILYMIPAARHIKTILDNILEPLAYECCVQATNIIYLRDAILRVIDSC